MAMAVPVYIIPVLVEAVVALVCGTYIHTLTHLIILSEYISIHTFMICYASFLLCAPGRSGRPRANFRLEVFTLVAVLHAWGPVTWEDLRQNTSSTHTCLHHDVRAKSKND
jgi:hypothetical protein